MAIVVDKSHRWRVVAAHAFLVALTLAVLFPFLMILSISLRPGNFSTGSIIPVAVSLCTTHTALTACVLSSASAARTCAGSTPRRQSQGTTRTSNPCAFAMLAHSSEK